MEKHSNLNTMFVKRQKDGKQDAKEGDSGVHRDARSTQVYDLNSHLFKSVNSGNLNEVEKLLREGANINTKQHFGGYDNTPLILAVEKNYVEIVQALLRNQNINVNLGDYYGNTALHTAASKGSEEMVKLLLEKRDIDVNAEITKCLTPPLHFAAYGNHEEVVELLLGVSGIQVNKTDKYGKTALHKSATVGHIEVTEILLNVPGILVNEKDNLNEHTPLHLATDFGHSDVVEVLLNHPDIDVNVNDKYGQTPLHTSAYHGNLKVVEMLLKAGINANEKTVQGFTADYWATKNGHAKVAEIIVKYRKSEEVSNANRGTTSKKVDNVTQSMKRIGISQGYKSSNTETNDQLLVAAKNGDLGKVEELLKRPDISVNCKDRHLNTPLHLASQKGHVELVRVFLQRPNVEVNAKNKDTSKFAYPVHGGDNPTRSQLNFGKTALYLAVENGHLDVVRELLSYKETDVNAKDKYDKSPLCVAVGKNDTGIVEILLSHPDIDVNAIDTCNDHFSALHVAVEAGNIAMTKAFLNKPNIKVNLKDKFYECTPLHLAVRGNRLEIVKAILNHSSVDVNAKDKYYDTPLHDAAKQGYLEIVIILLNANTNRNARNICGKTPLDLAIQNKHLLCADVLKKYQAT